jgi:hypothetical protein
MPTSRAKFVVPSAFDSVSCYRNLLAAKEKTMAVVTRCEPDDSPAWFDSKAATNSFSLNFYTILYS